MFSMHVDREVEKWPRAQGPLKLDGHQYSCHIASEDLSATCKLGQFLHYFRDLYPTAEEGEVLAHAGM